MTRLLEWLLDLQTIRLGSDSPLILQWDRRAPAWLVFIMALAGLTFIAMVYRREKTTGPRRITLALVRSFLLAIAMLVFCKPSLVLQRNRIEPSYAALLLDTSASMATEDAYAEPSSSEFAKAVAAGAGVERASSLEAYSRLDLVQSSLIRDNAAALRGLLQRNGVQLAGFSSSLEPLAFAPSDAALDEVTAVIHSLAPRGFSTDLAGALRKTLEKSEGRRLAAVIVATDGRATKGGDLRAVIDMASGRQVPIYPIPIGSTIPPLDIEVGPLRSAQTVFVHDVIAIEAQIQARSLSDDMLLEVKLIDASSGDSGEVVATELLTLSSQTQAASVELRTQPTRTGAIRYRVEVAPLPHERIVQNNFDRVDVTVTDDRLRLLFIEGYPRYEYRYLKNALLREKSMDVSVLLLEADEQFVQEGTTAIRRFPETPEELNRFDVVVFGDVDPRAGWLTQSQMLMLLDFVANEGGGFATIAGPRFAPQRFLGTPLERLLPIIVDPSGGSHENGLLTLGYRPALTPDGYTSRSFRFAANLEENRKIFEALPELYWIYRSHGPKPGATVLAAHPSLPNPRGQGGMPVAVLGQYGAGKIFFQGTDDTWRWRRHTGETLHDGYWVQVARELMRSSRVSQDRKFLIRTDRRSYAYGDPVHVAAEIFDAQTLRDHPESLEVAIYERTAPQAELATPKEAAASTARLIARLPLSRLAAESNLFEGSMVPPAPGSFSIEPVDLAWRNSDPAGGSVLVRVERPNLEFRQLAADHDSLASLAAATGGRVLSLDRLAEELAGIRDRRFVVPDDVVEPLWDSHLVFVLFMIAISAEWLLRKGFGLL